jgi:hypothetical protein
MRRRTRILTGAGVLAIVVVVPLAVWFATYRPMPLEPVCKGRPLSQWIDGTAIRQGASIDETTLNSMDSNAVPWLIWYLHKSSRGSFDKPLFRAELQLLRFNNSGSLAKSGLAKLGEKDRQRNSALALLSQYAPGTCFEETAARAILKSKSPIVDFDRERIFALGSFTHCPDLVLPTLCAGLTNGGTREACTLALSRFGPTAVSNVYRMALAEAGNNDPATSALLYLDQIAWTNLVEEKIRWMKLPPQPPQ